MVITSKHSSTPTSITRAVTGRHRFKIVPFSHMKLFHCGQYVSSTTFTLHDRDWVIRFYPNGLSSYTKYMAVSLELRSSKRIENVSVESAFLDNTGSPSNKTRSTTICTFNGSGSISFIFAMLEINSLDLQGFLIDDCLTIECTISILKPTRLIRSIILQPSDLPQQFGSLLESEEGSDVAFEVNGETFNAHRCVLAARSSVFKAEFFGHMKERTDQKIKVMEIEAPVFKAMLHFIYTDSLPEFEETSEESSNAMIQHLLVAANRYDLERLKILCAEVLYENIDKSNIFSVLALAAQHNCLQLKDACIEFIAVSCNLRDVFMADEFESLIQIYPSIVCDLRDKIASS